MKEIRISSVIWAICVSIVLFVTFLVMQTLGYILPSVTSEQYELRCFWMEFHLPPLSPIWWIPVMLFLTFSLSLIIKMIRHEDNNNIEEYRGTIDHTLVPFGWLAISGITLLAITIFLIIIAGLVWFISWLNNSESSIGLTWTLVILWCTPLLITMIWTIIFEKIFQKVYWKVFWKQEISWN